MMYEKMNGAMYKIVLPDVCVLFGETGTINYYGNADEIMDFAVLNGDQKLLEAIKKTFDGTLNEDPEIIEVLSNEPLVTSTYKNKEFIIAFHNIYGNIVYGQAGEIEAHFEYIKDNDGSLKRLVKIRMKDVSLHNEWVVPEHAQGLKGFFTNTDDEDDIVNTVYYCDLEFDNEVEMIIDSKKPCDPNIERFLREYCGGEQCDWKKMLSKEEI